MQLASKSKCNDQACQYDPAQGRGKPVGNIRSFKSTHGIMIPENDCETPALQNSNTFADTGMEGF